MNSAFSVDEIVESFWSEQSAAAAMSHHSPSEWAFERLMQEVSRGPISPTSSATCNRPIAPSVSSNSKSAETDKDEISEQRLDQSSKAPAGSDGYRALLKARLDIACAAVALSRASAAKPGESSPLPESQLQVTKPVQLGSQADGSGHVVSTVQSASDGGPRGVAALSSTQINSGIQVKRTTSESSREDSEDDEVEGDTGTTNNSDPVEVKRVRRMQSNRESARRSRRRKQEHMNELETQVGQLKGEHTSLLKRLTDINSKFDNASVDNRILKAGIETLRTKVKMAEETVKRVTGINPLLLAMSNLQGPAGMTPFVGNTVDTFSTGAIPVQQPNPNHHYFHQPQPFTHPSMDSNFPEVGNLQLQNEDGGGGGGGGGGGPNSMPLPSIPGWSANCKP